jgi:hypothetical protein
VAPDWRDLIELISRNPLRESSSATFRAPRALELTQGLKPLAESYCPFGAETKRSCVST